MAADKSSRYFQGGFRATDMSLDIARSIAEALNSPFDAESTRQFAADLHRTYFESVIQTLGLAQTQVAFESGNARSVDVFISRTQTVHLDEHLDFWLYNLTHLLTIAACKALSYDERSALLELLKDASDPETFPANHAAIRKRFLPYLSSHPDCMELSHALSRSMLVFIICHEIAHSTLGHSPKKPSSENELAADQRASDYFLTIQKAGKSVSWIYVHEKLLCAPLILFRLLSLGESVMALRTGNEPLRNSHPAPLTRFEHTRARLGNVLSDGALYIVNGFGLALDDIRSDLDLSVEHWK